MGKFCVKCGSPLAEGKECACQGGTPAAIPEPAAQAPVEPVQAPAAAAEPQEGAAQTAQVTMDKIKASEAMGEAKNVGKDILNIYKNPEQIMGKENSLTTTIVILAMQSIAIFAVVSILINNLIETMAKAMGIKVKEIKSEIDIEYVKIFLAVALSCAAFYAIHTAITYLVFAVWKKEKIDFKTTANKFCYLMLPLTVTIILAFAASYIHEYLVMAVIGYGIVHYCILTFMYFRHNFKLEEKLLLIVTPIIIIATAALGGFATGKITKAFLPDSDEMGSIQEMLIMVVLYDQLGDLF